MSDQPDETLASPALAAPATAPEPDWPATDVGALVDDTGADTPVDILVDPQAPETPRFGEPAIHVHSPSVALGRALPAQVQALPVLAAAVPQPTPTGGGNRLSTLAHGLSFSGQARVSGSMTVAGEMDGRLQALDPIAGEGHVTITETGVFSGDVLARNISVLGQTSGLLDASGGRVALHDTAVVDGRIRYTHLQVNGADLNAQLERVRPDGEGPARR